ncbi:hypothetical protein [Streptomyces griseoviridis]|jgi:hypothetical protein|uniref:Gliding motility protein n=1 Tax=Streptomyces griseoviridis TaxID=45398 RepID=A0ABT9LLT1_STRGD|nr:hypothetical protein [Streptomyces griseoviridis]MDP9684487.1 hypothetical protein [Streptomyces griseoviridis]GGT05890.1 hypothetical protein GCM10010240_44130 [Streptomyces griseoviridis]
MGVFARLLRRSKATEEASDAGARSGTAAGATAAGEAVGTGREPAELEAAGAGAVEIPQQSAGEAAGHEAGEGART